MTHYLKKSLVTFFVLMLPYINHGSKAMDEGDDNSLAHRGTSLTLKTSFDNEDTSPHSPPISPSWMSYLVLDPVNKAIQTTSAIIEYAKQNPKKAIILGIAYQMTAVEAVTDYLNCWTGTGSGMKRVNVWWKVSENSHTEEDSGALSTTMPQMTGDGTPPQVWTCRHHHSNNTWGAPYTVWVEALN